MIESLTEPQGGPSGRLFFVLLLECAVYLFNDMSEHKDNREIEIKLRLASFADYLKLLGFLGSIDSEHELENCFFDSEDRQLAKAGWAFRVRINNSAGLITVKGLSTPDGLATVRDEIESEISRGEALDIVGLRQDVLGLEGEPVAFIRERFPDIKLARLIDFRTHRKHKTFRMGDCDYCLQIDQTYFCDGSVDYELEVELESTEQTPVVEDCLRKMFDRLDVVFCQETESKLARALKRAGLK